MCFTSILVSAALAKRGARDASSAGDSGVMAAENGTRTFAFLRPSLWQHASVASCAWICSAAVTSCSEERTGSRPGRLSRVGGEVMLDQSRVTRTLQVDWRISREPAGEKKTIFDVKCMRRTSFLLTSLTPIPTPPSSSRSLLITMNHIIKYDLI
jgi:hypothetical protein